MMSIPRYVCVGLLCDILHDEPHPAQHSTKLRPTCAHRTDEVTMQLGPIT